MIQHTTNAISRWLDSRTPGQDYGLCILFGVLNALAMPPVYLFPVLFLTFPIFIRLLDKSLTIRQAFFKTFLFHLAFHIAGLYWITNALFVDISHNWWVIPFALVSLPALMAAYPAIAASLWYMMAWQGTARFLSLVTLLALSEMARGIAFTGFPWNLWGYTWTAILPVMQISALIGIYGLTFITLFLAALPLMAHRNYRERSLRIVGFIGLALFVACIAWGSGRLSVPMPENKTPYHVRIVQPDIKQEAKWDPERMLQNERKLWAYSIQPSDTPPDLIVWPETAISLFRTEDVGRLAFYAQSFLQPKTIVALGAMESEVEVDTGNPVFFNRIDFINNQGRRVGYYDKFHLVPFGEYLPFQKLWPVRPVAFKSGSLSPGPGLRIVKTPSSVSFSPMICYEIVFPGRTTPRNERPNAILNVTNDAWYGNTSGPYQHFAITRTRAIEEGLPVIRAANTGISGMIDPFGRVMQKLPLNTAGIIDQPLPPHLEPTIFARYGHSLFYAMVIAVWLLAWLFQHSRNRTLPYVQ